MILFLAKEDDSSTKTLPVVLVRGSVEKPAKFSAGAGWCGGRFENSFGCGRMRDPRAFAGIVFPTLVRGTMQLPDLLQNAKLSQVNFEDTSAEVHQGFYEQFQAIKAAVEAFVSESVRDNSVEEILFVGHSLGGAVAALLGASLAPRFEDESIRVVTFSTPKIGNGEFQKLFQERQGIRASSSLLIYL